MLVLAQSKVVSDFNRFPVYRLHWLRARARFNRWKEELMLTKYEMQWSVRYFMFQAHRWENIRDMDSNTRCMKGFAAEKIALFNELGRMAELAYLTVFSLHPKLWIPVPHM